MAIADDGQGCKQPLPLATSSSEWDYQQDEKPATYFQDIIHGHKFPCSAASVETELLCFIHLIQSVLTCISACEYNFSWSYGLQESFFSSGICIIDLVVYLILRYTLFTVKLSTCCLDCNLQINRLAGT